MRKLLNKPQVKPLIFYGLLLVPTIFLCCTQDFAQDSGFFIIVLAMLLTSFIEIPILTIRTKKPEYSESEARCVSELYGVPVLEELQKDPERRYWTRITLNMGGFIIPLLFSLYLLLFFEPAGEYTLPLLEIIMIALLVALITFMVTEVKAGVGIIVPNYAGLFAIPLGLLLAPPDLPLALVSLLLIFVPAIFGILLAMAIALLTLPRSNVGSAFFNLGGVGSFYSIYLISFLALLLGSMA
ncbi:MAG: DUF1614 domain-containing protein [Candidatus Methanospirareceae archaeon]